MKKKSLTLLLSALATLLTTACVNEKAISTTAQGYLDAMANFKPNEAIPYASQATVDGYIKYVNTVLMPQLDTNKVLQQAISVDIPATITIDNIDVTSDTTATVAYTKQTPSRTAHESIALIKEDGKWKVEVLLAAPTMLTPQQSLSNKTIKELDSVKFTARKASDTLR